MPSFPLSTSSQSNKKINTQSREGKSTLADSDKENSKSSLKYGNTFSGSPENRQQENIGEPYLPQTPAVRFRLEDLIGNTEDAFNCVPPAGTPTDHVLWQSGSRSSVVSASERDLPRGQKRARSSSPPSQLDHHNALEISRNSLNVENVQKALKTPLADPTQELWNRYTNANIPKRETTEKPASMFNSLFPSSPQTPSTASRDSALRRTVSCGIEWPTSNSKRRRIEAGDTLNRAKSIFAASKREILAQGLPKTSRVSLLVEKIQESLSKKLKEEGPSSSSPLPQRQPQEHLSPTKQLTRATIQTEGVLQLENENAAGSRSGNSTKLDCDGSSSDFGDDGLDIDFFESVELARVHDLPNQDGGVSEDALQIQVRHGSLHSSTGARAVEKSQSGQQAYRPVVDDEFDVEDDDLFSHDLQDLAAKFDSSELGCNEPDVKPQKPCLDRVPGGVLQPEKNLDDSFDDDDDLWNDIMNEKSVVGIRESNHIHQVRYD